MPTPSLNVRAHFFSLTLILTLLILILNLEVEDVHVNLHPRLSIFALGQAILSDDEIRARWSRLRAGLEKIHVKQMESAGHTHNTLNVTAADIALHRTPISMHKHSFVGMKDPGLTSPILYLNNTNPAPIQVPLRAIAQHVLFGPANETSNGTSETSDPSPALPTMVPGQKGAMPFSDMPLRPMTRLCQFQECTSLGEISKSFGKRLLHMYGSSPVGHLQDFGSTFGHAAHYVPTRGIIPNGRRALANDSTIRAVEDFARHIGHPLTQPEMEGALLKQGDKLAHAVGWNNLDFVTPPHNDQRSAFLMSRMKARNAFWCSISDNKLPYCQTLERVRAASDDGDESGDDEEEEGRDGSIGAVGRGIADGEDETAEPLDMVGIFAADEVSGGDGGVFQTAENSRTAERNMKDTIDTVGQERVERSVRVDGEWRQLLISAVDGEGQTGPKKITITVSDVKRSCNVQGGCFLLPTPPGGNPPSNIFDLLPKRAFKDSTVAWKPSHFDGEYQPKSSAGNSTNDAISRFERQLPARIWEKAPLFSRLVIQVVDPVAPPPGLSAEGNSGRSDDNLDDESTDTLQGLFVKRRVLGTWKERIETVAIRAAIFPHLISSSEDQTMPPPAPLSDSTSDPIVAANLEHAESEAEKGADSDQVELQNAYDGGLPIVWLRDGEGEVEERMWELVQSMPQLNDCLGPYDVTRRVCHFPLLVSLTLRV